ncbi:IBR finger domain-containing protein [Colletotrichum kahawae]|uniref:RBR-type E3 ubiquitin transferase n=1 Tax=Colletotrichum kahawae TaxID=34407 RepID=A0AAD9YIC6_COLKA|nr:IBR finger domain-containing protein [Colletotrichum kahawae]
MLCHDIDEETLHLVIQMQLEDLEDMKNCTKGKQKEGSLPDSELAFETYQSELKTCEQRVPDRAMSLSIQKAIRTDGKLVTVFSAQERQSERDREMAVRLSRGETTSANSKTTSPGQDESDLDADMLRKLQQLYVSADADDDDALDQPESSSWAASRSDMNGTAKPLEVAKEPCISCQDSFPVTKLSPCPCSHLYCHDCLRSLFEACLTDESLFPARCCGQQIPVDDHRPVLGSKLVGQFRAKEVEFSTPNRTYCHQPTCSTFVPVEFIKNDVATCPQCYCRTCAMCKGAEHRGDECGQDTATQFLLQLAAENGWQRCFSCRRVVELEYGCNHMTCRCGAHFCYTCGMKWKTCACAQWNEERLYARANVNVDRIAGARQFDAQRRAQLVDREAQNLVENHESAHGAWRYRSGIFTCEECHDTLPRSIYECGRCHIRACRRCRFNRL